MTRWRWATVVAFALYVLAAVWNVVDVLLGIQPPHWLLSANTFLFFTFAALHASHVLGVRATIVFIIITFGVSFVFETVGVLTGWIYGAYYYTEKLGPQLGVVPILIPIAWFMMIYASYAVVQTLAGDIQRRSLWWGAWLAMLGAMAMTAWDLGMDPQMTARGHWIWTQGGAYFGIPVHNFVGWLATTFVVFLLFYLFESRQPARAIQFTEPFARLAVIAYGVQGTATVIALMAGDQHAVAMITFFAMGAFFLMALTRILATRGKSS